tara:strand:+ start:652 stop:2025 length:1374 start_codon:yes stop_codon:yes gene_type:complete
MTTPFRVRVREKQWNYTKADKEGNVKLRTHNLMNGGYCGELCVSDDDYEMFLQVCADCLSNGEKLFVVEQKSHPAYKLFFDFDVCLFDIIDNVHDWYTKLCKILVSAINELFDEKLDAFEIICSVAEVKKVRKCQRECYKYGVHINSSNIIVNESIMLKLREAIVQKLQNNFEKNGPTSWDEDVDTAVYTSSGLRMNFMNKNVRCKCKDRDNCEKCEGTGKFDEGRPYHPLIAMTQDYSHTYFPQGDLTFDFVYDILQRTCIRVTDKSGPNIQFNRSPPSWFEDSSLFQAPTGLIKETIPKKRKLTEGIDSVENKLVGKQDLSRSDLEAFNTFFRSLCNRKILPKQYKGIEITTAFSFQTNNVRSSVIARIDSQFCMNIGREHNTNTVYMYANLVTRKAYMKCYCRCVTTEGRRTIVRGQVQMCKDYCSSEIDASGLKMSITSNHETNVKPRVMAMF